MTCLQILNGRDAAAARGPPRAARGAALRRGSWSRGTTGPLDGRGILVVHNPAFDPVRARGVAAALEEGVLARVDPAYSHLDPARQPARLELSAGGAFSGVIIADAVGSCAGRFTLTGALVTLSRSPLAVTASRRCACAPAEAIAPRRPRAAAPPAASARCRRRRSSPVTRGRDAAVKPDPASCSSAAGPRRSPTRSSLALLLRTGAPGPAPRRRARRGAARAPRERRRARPGELRELCATRGLGPAKAASLKAALELGRRLLAGGRPPRARLSSSREVAERSRRGSSTCRARSSSPCCSTRATR